MNRRYMGGKVPIIIFKKQMKFGNEYFLVDFTGEGSSVTLQQETRNIEKTIILIK